jgi:hypothetical protein
MNSNAEIFSYIVNGKLAHRDSMGNSEVLTRGDLQFTSAGRGISHSEFNGSDKEFVHFIQIWVLPNKNGLQPNYQTIHIDEHEKINRLALLVAPINNSPDTTTPIVEVAASTTTTSEVKMSGINSEAKKKSNNNNSGPFTHKKVAAINQDIKMYASILQPDQTITFTLPGMYVSLAISLPFIHITYYVLYLYLHSFIHLFIRCTNNTPFFVFAGNSWSSWLCSFNSGCIRYDK